MSRSHDPKLAATWDIESLSDALAGFFDSGYGDCEHPALGMSPNAMQREAALLFGARSHRIRPYNREFLAFTMPAPKKDTSKIVPGRGVKINGIHYWNDAFKTPAWENREVLVRYDPYDVSRACAWLDKRWFDLRSEFAAEFKGRSEREIRLISAEIRERSAREGKRRNTTAEQLASYMRGTYLSEMVLRQRIKDAESRPANTHLHVVPENDVAEVETLADLVPDIWYEIGDQIKEEDLIELGDF